MDETVTHVSETEVRVCQTVTHRQPPYLSTCGFTCDLVYLATSLKTRGQSFLLNFMVLAKMQIRVNV